MNIRSKLLAGYLPLASLLLLVSYYSLHTLNSLDKIMDSIIRVDVPLINASDQMIESVLAQELYANRYTVLKSKEMQKGFWQRSREFDDNLDKLKKIPEIDRAMIADIGAAHESYNDSYAVALAQLKNNPAWSRKQDALIHKRQKELIDLIKTLSHRAGKSQSGKVELTAKLGTTAYRTMAVICLLGLFISTGAAFVITRNIYHSVTKLKRATVLVAEGKFDDLPKVHGRDELGELSEAFSSMAQRLKTLEEMLLDSNPLTHLPGGIAVENVLKKRISSCAPFAFCLMDVDNFKAYNDHYGYARGNEVIKLTAKIIENATRSFGSSADFVGHIGGDDFVVITTPDRFQAVCTEIIKNFDRETPELYDAEDRAIGYIIGVTRQGVEMNFPFVSLSIAIVTSQRNDINNHLEVGEIAADLKEYAKSLKGSKYVVNRRRLACRDAQDTSQCESEIKEDAG